MASRGFYDRQNVKYEEKIGPMMILKFLEREVLRQKNYQDGVIILVFSSRIQELVLCICIVQVSGRQ